MKPESLELLINLHHKKRDTKITYDEAYTNWSKFSRGLAEQEIKESMGNADSRTWVHAGFAVTLRKNYTASGDTFIITEIESVEDE